MRYLKVIVTFAMLASIGSTKQADIKLVNQPLDVVQARISGRWRVQYWQGGIAGIRIDAKNGEYFNFTETTIQSGDDSGEKLNAAITWKRVRWGNVGDSTWILTYGNISFPNEYLVYGIENGVLQLNEYAIDDGFTVFLRRW